MDAIILIDIVTGEEMSFSSLYKAGKFLDIDPCFVNYYNGKIWKNKYMVKVDRSKLILEELWLPSYD